MSNMGVLHACPLCDMLMVRNIVRFGFSLSDTVSDLISNGSWRWPHDWLSRFPNVVNIPVPDINNELNDVCAFIGMSSVPPRLVDVLAFLIPSKGSSVSNVISQIVLAAMTYCLWNERNSRLFKKKKLTADHIVQLITSLMRLKLITFKFKKMTTSLIATQLGRPIMFDSYTSSMCLDPWGKCTYARVLIEMRADKELMDSLVVVVPFTNGKGHSLDNIEVEYEWKPPRCATCCTFDHNDDKCPKIVKEVKSTPTNQVDEEGFTTVNRKKSRTAPKKQVAGVRLSKSKPNMVYRRVEKGESSLKLSDGAGLNSKRADKDPSSSTNGNGIELKNSFASLGGDTDDNWFSAPDYSSGVFNVINDSDSEDVDEELVAEEDRRNVTYDNKGASTPYAEVAHD
ncbi:reverse transcriptase domain, reverse transcriptase zinc-binding domain protein [Tanacetum coccineum]